MMKGTTLSKPAATLELGCEPYPDGEAGVFLLTILIPDDALRAHVSKHELHFELPMAPGWLFRSALEGGGCAPYLDGRLGLLQGVFHEGHWVSILSRNGVQEHEYLEHLKTLDWMLGAVRIQAEAELDQVRKALEGSAGSDFRLFFISGPVADSSLTNIGFESLDEAKAHSLPTGDAPIGIRSAAGWHTFQPAFGWQGPHPTMRRQ